MKYPVESGERKNPIIVWDNWIIRNNMDQEREEKLAQKKSNEMFNSITEKQKPENQNQTHNSRREGMGPNTKRKPSWAPCIPSPCIPSPCNISPCNLSPCNLIFPITKSYPKKRVSEQ